MEKIKPLIHKKEIKNYLNSLWKTKEFKESAQNPQGFIHHWVELFSDSPRMFFSMTDDFYEKGHFTSWMNCVSIREYENDAINDLYYLHEIIHCCTIPYKLGLNFSEWKSKMFYNELTTSLYSEVLVYFHLPQLRAKSFNFKIWADAFLDKKNIKHESPEFFNSLVAERRRIYLNPAPQDSAELEIAKYQNQNEEWATLWKDSYNEIEGFMEKFYLLTQTDPKAASDLHYAWICSLIKKGGKNYPFPQEAEAFAKIYWKIKQ